MEQKEEIELPKLQIGEILKRMGLTYRQAGELIGANASEVQRYTKPGENLTMYSLARIAKGLDCTVKELFVDEESEFEDMYDKKGHRIGVLFKKEEATR